YFGAHVIQHISEIDDFRLASRILKNGTAVGERGRHHQVFGAGDRDFIEEDFRCSEALDHGFDITMLRMNPGAEFLESLDVKIDGPRSDRASARQRNPRMSCTHKTRTQDAN